MKKGYASAATSENYRKIRESLFSQYIVDHKKTKARRPLMENRP
jgi:hypothetical protein